MTAPEPKEEATYIISVCSVAEYRMALPIPACSAFLTSGRSPWFSSLPSSEGGTSESATTSPSRAMTLTRAWTARAREPVSSGASLRRSRISLEAMREATRASSSRCWRVPEVMACSRFRER